MTDAAQPSRRQLRRPGSPRMVRHVVKVSTEQEARLAARADERGITVSRLLVESALSGGAEMAAARASLGGELFRVVRVLGKVGVNVNQIARATNATGEIQDSTEAALAAIERVTDRLQLVLDDLDVSR